MIDSYVKDSVRLISSVSLPQSEKDRIADYIIQKRKARKNLSKKYITAASAVAVLAISTVMIVRVTK